MEVWVAISPQMGVTSLVHIPCGFWGTAPGFELHLRGYHARLPILFFSTKFMTFHISTTFSNLEEDFLDFL